MNILKLLACSFLYRFWYFHQILWFIFRAFAWFLTVLSKNITVVVKWKNVLISSGLLISLLYFVSERGAVESNWGSTRKWNSWSLPLISSDLGQVIWSLQFSILPPIKWKLFIRWFLRFLHIENSVLFADKQFLQFGYKCHHMPFTFWKAQLPWCFVYTE